MNKFLSIFLLVILGIFCLSNLSEAAEVSSNKLSFKGSPVSLTFNNGKLFLNVFKNETEAVRFDVGVSKASEKTLERIKFFKPESITVVTWNKANLLAVFRLTDKENSHFVAFSILNPDINGGGNPIAANWEYLYAAALDEELIYFMSPQTDMILLMSGVLSDGVAPVKGHVILTACEIPVFTSLTLLEFKRAK